MKIIQQKSAAEFLEINEMFLLKEETFYNLILGLAGRMKNGEQDESEATYYTVMENEEIIGQALRTNFDKNLILGKLDEGVAEFLAKKLKDSLHNLQGVFGKIEDAQAFSKAWGKETEVLMHLGVYEANQIILPKNTKGSIRLATEEDLPLVEEFSIGYIKDCYPKQLEKGNEAIIGAQRNIKNKYLYLLEVEGEVVSMAANNRESKNAGTIAWVYTPPQHRKKGYASMVTALLSQKILENGKPLCNLFTDLSNPTSNSIYQKIGYRRLGESIDLKFL